MGLGIVLVNRGTRALEPMYEGIRAVLLPEYEGISAGVREY